MASSLADVLTAGSFVDCYIGQTRRAIDTALRFLAHSFWIAAIESCLSFSILRPAATTNADPCAMTSRVDPVPVIVYPPQWGLPPRR